MRKYSFDSPNRLSSKQGATKDANLIMKGHYILLKEHILTMSLNKVSRTILAILYYSFLSFINRVKL